MQRICSVNLKQISAWLNMTDVINCFVNMRLLLTYFHVINLFVLL